MGEITKMEERGAKVGILGATFNTGNMGVSMLAAGAIRCVLHRYPRAEVMLLDYARESRPFEIIHEGRPVRIGFVNIRFSKRFYLPNNIALLLLLAVLAGLVPSRALRRRLLERNRYMKAVLETEAFFSLSGGDSFSDIYGLGRFLYVALPQLLVLLAGKRLILLPQTLGPFRGGFSRTVAKYIMKRAEVIYSRDHSGLRATRELLGLEEGDRTLRFCYDLAFDVDPTPPGELKIEGLRSGAAPLAGVNVSGLLLAGGYNGGNMFGLTVEYGDLVRQLVAHLIEKQSAKVLLIPHVFGGPDSVESDTGACEAVYEELKAKYEGRIGVVRGRYRHDEIKHVIGQCEFFVGARMHACIAALSQCIPTVGVAYSDKFAGMMGAIGFAETVIDPRRMGVGQMLRIVDEAYGKRQSIRARLEEVIPQVRQTIRGALVDVPCEGEAELAPSRPRRLAEGN